MSKRQNSLRIALSEYFHRIPAYSKALILLIAATLIAAAVNRVAPSSGNVAIIYILAVVIISCITTGYKWGILTAAASVLCLDFFFTPPVFSLHFNPSGSPLTFLIMLTVALITSTLTTRIVEQAQQSIRRETRTQQLYSITKKLLATRGLENIVSFSSGYIQSIYDCESDFYIIAVKRTEARLVPLGNAPVLAGEDAEAAMLSYHNQIASGCGAGTHVNATRFFMPLVSQGQVLGVIGLHHRDGKPFSDPDMTFLDMIVSQIAMALSRQKLSDEQRKITIEAEKEKMRSNLLRAISHDLRMPLTAILDASSEILENGEQCSQERHDHLVSDIRGESQWLIRMVENLLSVTRMQGDETKVTKTPEQVESIICEAVTRIHSRFSDRIIHTEITDRLLTVPMDATLIAQVVINLLENAIKHSGSDTKIDISVHAESRWAIFEIADNGEGIAESDLPHMFDGFASRDTTDDSSRGMGIGLSICRSIIKAHGGSIWAENLPEGGAKFTFRIPKK